MSTHTIGTGKVNLSTTFDIPDARQIGRAAYVVGKSRNEFCREAILAAVRQLQSERVRQIGRTGLGMCMLGLVIFGAMTGQDLRRSARITRGAARRKWEELA